LRTPIHALHCTKLSSPLKKTQSPRRALSQNQDNLTDIIDDMEQLILQPSPPRALTTTAQLEAVITENRNGFRFMDLPAELRKMVYAELFTVNGSVRVTIFLEEPHLLPPLQVCSEIRTEGLSMIWGRNKVELGFYCNWANNSSLLHMPTLRHLPIKSFTWTATPSECCRQIPVPSCSAARQVPVNPSKRSRTESRDHSVLRAASLVAFQTASHPSANDIF
jgi:hypothetical protein